MAENGGEAPAAKKSKYSQNDTDFKVTDELLKDFSRDGYIIVKLVFNSHAHQEESVALMYYMDCCKQELIM